MSAKRPMCAGLIGIAALSGGSKRKISVIIRLPNTFGARLLAQAASKYSAKALSLTSCSAAYAVKPKSAMYFALRSSGSTGSSDFHALIVSSEVTMGARSGSGK